VRYLEGRGAAAKAPATKTPAIMIFYAAVSSMRLPARGGCGRRGCAGTSETIALASDEIDNVRELSAEGRQRADDGVDALAGAEEPNVNSIRCPGTPNVVLRLS
jgi:hypothetical protein